MRPAWSGLKGRTQRPVCGHKHCTVCGRWRPILDFHVNARDDDGNCVRLQTICMCCERIRGRIRNGNRARGRPYEPRKPLMTAEQKLQTRREFYERARKDPKRAALQREYQRIWAEAKRREKGVPPRNFKHRRTVIDKAERIFLDPAPIIAEIERQNGAINQVDLAALAGLPVRAIYRLQVGESKRVRLDVADKLAMALDVPLAVLYDDERESS